MVNKAKGWSRGVVVLGLLGLWAGAGALADVKKDRGQMTLSDQDRDFMKEAAAGGLAEVELGRLAEKRASMDQVKGFGKHMVKDHSKANAELKGLAERKGVALPTDMDAKEKDTYQRLAALSGYEFDRQYMHEMVSDHEKDVAAFEREADKGGDKDVKGWAQKTLPTLRDHLRMARDLEDKMSKQRSSSR